MAYQEGTLAVNTGTQDYSVVFSPAFSSAPDVIIAVLENTSGDGTKLAINVNVEAKSTTGFDVHLDALPNTNNYVLVWIAGDAAIFFQAITQNVKKLTELPRLLEDIDPHDLVPIVRMSPIPRTMYALHEDVTKGFSTYLITPPAGPTSSGLVGQWSFDSSYLYIYTGSQWSRTPLQTITSWASAVSFNDKRWGTETLSNATQVHTITFSSPFGVGNVPVIRTAQVQNTVDGTILALYGIVSSITKTDFKVVLNAPTDSGNYKLVYEAEQLP